MGLVEGEAYTALRDHFRAELDAHAVARELVDRRNRAREDDTQERWERLHDAYLQEVDRIDEEVAARAAAERAAQRARRKPGYLRRWTPLHLPQPSQLRRWSTRWSPCTGFRPSCRRQTSPT
jgi:hypothetical protein